MSLDIPNRTADTTTHSFSDDDDDSDSDDFLLSTTHTTNPTSNAAAATANGDREALVRKKLLENFYGTTSTTEDGTDEPMASRSRRSHSRVGTDNNSNIIAIVDVDNIDSKDFDPNKFVKQHIQSSSVQALLEVEEQLSLQVRTYDSTLQTLVYENYTKFIDVTNAIKSIGTTVTTTNEEQIQQLITCTNAIYQTSRVMMTMDATPTAGEDPNATSTTRTIGTIRHQVVEKIRIQRLLQRLRTLFVLPNTIRQCIQQQQYTTAIVKYNQAALILAKYHHRDVDDGTDASRTTTTTTTFESFSSITNDCIRLLQQLNGQLHHQFYVWSGRSSLLEWTTSQHHHQMTNTTSNHHHHENDEADVPPPELPKSMMEIFESARALSMLQALFQNNQKKNDDRTTMTTTTNTTSIDATRDPFMDDDELYSMSLSAATRLLDRLLDAHSIQVQEYKFMHHHSTTMAGDDYRNDGKNQNHISSSSNNNNNNSTGSLLGIMAPESSHSVGGTTAGLDAETEDHDTYLIPQTVLVAILECAALYQQSFPSHQQQHMNQDDASSERNYYLMEFITESYTTFMTHIRSILLQDENLGGGGAIPNTNESDGVNNEYDDDNAMVESEKNDNDISPEEISKALVVLVQYVQAFTNRLVDELRLNVDYTNQLMQQAVDLASSLVRRRVDNHFRTLRYSIVNDCLIPLTDRIVTEHERIVTSNNNKNDDESNTNQMLPELIQMASSTLSDSLQLVDDTIRSIYADTISSTAKNTDDNNVVGIVPSDVQDAVQASTYRLISWLANTFEIIVGGDPTDYNHIAQAQKQTNDETNTDSAGNLSNKIVVVKEGIGESCEDELLALLYAARDNIYRVCDGTIQSDIILSIIELCRLSETLVPQQIEQSFQYGSGAGAGGKRKTASSQRDLFPSSPDATTSSTASISRKSGSSRGHVHISNRFQVAGSRIFTILIRNTAFEATYRLLLSNVTSDTTESEGRRPSENVLAVATYAKTLSVQCATLFGGTKRAGPVPIWDDTIFHSSTSSMISAAGMRSSRKSGLYLDVERMFREKVTIYSHPSDVLEYSRDTALFQYFKIVLRSWYENIREYSTTTYSSDEYMQMQIDLVFIKYIIPHYLSNDFHDHSNNGTNGRTALTTLMNDVVGSGGRPSAKHGPQPLCAQQQP